MEDLLGDFEYEVQVPYLFYKNAAEEINGIWFYDPDDCHAASNLFRRYRQLLNPHFVSLHQL